MSLTNLWNRLEDLKFLVELRSIVVRLYKNVIDTFRNIQSWLEEINCNIGVRKGCSMSFTLFDLYIDKLEGYSEQGGHVNQFLISTIITFIFILMILFLC